MSLFKILALVSKRPREFQQMVVAVPIFSEGFGSITSHTSHVPPDDMFWYAGRGASITGWVKTKSKVEIVKKQIWIESKMNSAHIRLFTSTLNPQPHSIWTLSSLVYFLASKKWQENSNDIVMYQVVNAGIPVLYTVTL